MQTTFYMNGYLWSVIFVDPLSPQLIDRTGERRLATTDPVTRQIYVSYPLDESLLRRVILHELSHAALLSYELLDDIHQMIIPRNWIDMEEWICNYIADYGSRIFRAANSVLANHKE